MKLRLLLVFLTALVSFSGKKPEIRIIAHTSAEKAASGPVENSRMRAEITLQRIFKYYDTGHDNLFRENYPDKPGIKVTYLSGNDTVTGDRVAYLWPTSGMFSALNTLLKTTGRKQYLKMLEKKIIPGLDNYYDPARIPSAYQSYITLTGKSDRYYDDNIWLALDFCELYMLSKKHIYLQKAAETWDFVLSGWDKTLGGGIYWCEQKKQSKNTCSNAPASVLAFRLFQATGDSTFFKWGLRIYNWTRSNLQDTTDHLYFDNKSLTGRTDRRKYTYNSGQMLQAAAMLYKLTGNQEYLREAQNMASSVITYFTDDYKTPEGKTIRLFKNTGNWFNAILFRGYEELYRLDGDKSYIGIFEDNLNQVWDHARDVNGLFSKDWKGTRQDQYKWLLDQASLVELWSRIAGISAITVPNISPDPK